MKFRKNVAYPIQVLRFSVKRGFCCIKNIPLFSSIPLKFKNMNKSYLIVLCLVIQLQLSGQTDSLTATISGIITGKSAVVGVQITEIETGTSVTLNPEYKYPLMSVFKLHLGVTVLHAIDEGKLSLEQGVLIKKSDLMENTWSPIRVKYPEGNVTLTINELLQYTIAGSDNNGCDILLSLIGGPSAVENYMHEIGVNAVQIRVNENDMHQHPDTLYANWTKLDAAASLLQLVYSGKILKATTNKFLMETLYATTTGPLRLKGQLPEGTAVAHKTGTAGEDNNGVTAAVNDIGIVTLPNGNHLIICVFVRNTKEAFETNEKIIADISYAAWVYFGI
jgi:beta-lactamase class A